MFILQVAVAAAFHLEHLELVVLAVALVEHLNSNKTMEQSTRAAAAVVVAEAVPLAVMAVLVWLF
jgi:hypothetical protein